MLHFDAVPESVRALLIRLAPHPALGNFALGGGTSLALRFGHRFSVDLDFFTTLPFSADGLFADLGLENASVVSRAANSLTADAGGVKLDLIHRSYPLLGPVEHLDEIPVVSLPDVVAMKLNAIANRGSKKDFFDFVELLDHLTIETMIGCFTRKYPMNDAFAVIRSLAWFEDAELEPEPVSLNGRTWEEVKRRTSAAVAGL